MAGVEPASRHIFSLVFPLNHISNADGIIDVLDSQHARLHVLARSSGDRT